MSIPSDIEIAQQANLKHIDEIAEQMGLDPSTDLEHYGKYMAKVNLEVLDRLQDRPNAKYIDVTAINHSPLGEGKSTTTVGLGQAMQHIGKRAVVTMRQPSMGPTFGSKGGAAGGGYSQIVPMETFNLHLTGDIHAVGTAHNLIAAMLDASLHHGNPLNIDPRNIQWRRVMDLNDRALREIVIGLGGRADGFTRQTGFDITVASEIMAILALKPVNRHSGAFVLATVSLLCFIPYEHRDNLHYYLYCNFLLDELDFVIVLSCHLTKKLQQKVF